MDKKMFTGATLEEALKSGALKQSGIVLVGMVKLSEEAGHISFTKAGCDNWVQLPTEMIEEAEHIGESPCQGHSHPQFRITLKSPKDAQAKLLAALLAQSPQQGAMGGPPQYGGMGSPGPFGGQTGAPPMPGSQQHGTARMGGAGLGGLGGLGGGRGSLGAWGCWDSTCTDCILYEYVCNGAGACWHICKIWTERPCTRCIWPW
jgi:hypothetical protein